MERLEEEGEEQKKVGTGLLASHGRQEGDILLPASTLSVLLLRFAASDGLEPRTSPDQPTRQDCFPIQRAFPRIFKKFLLKEISIFQFENFGNGISANSYYFESKTCEREMVPSLATTPPPPPPASLQTTLSRALFEGRSISIMVPRSSTLCAHRVHVTYNNKIYIYVYLWYLN